MTRSELDAAHTTAIRRHWRTLVDAGGVPPQALLDDLAAIADPQPGAPLVEEPPADPEPAARAPARRTTTRRRPS